MPIKLIVGLGNPGDKYIKTRHNVGFWFLDRLNSEYGGEFREETKFFGQIKKITVNSNSCWLLKPTTFMNLSGKSIAALAHFYKIDPEDILVVHDELDLSVDDIRLKLSGGHGGHNGLRDTINCLGSKNFNRLRIGIGHPGNSKKVVSYVLKRPSIDDTISIENTINKAINLIDIIIAKDFSVAMNKLHSK